MDEPPPGQQATGVAAWDAAWEAVLDAEGPAVAPESAAGFDPAANPPPGGWAGLQATLQQILEELEEGREGQQQQQAVLVQMQATLQQVLAAAQQQQATLVQLQAGLQQMQEGLQQMQEGQQQMLVRQANDRRRWHNRKAQQAFRQASFQVALEPLCKEQPPPAGAKGAAALGALPPAGTFPQTWLAGSLLTDAQLNTLVAFYGEPFAAGGTLNDRLEAFKTFIT